MLYNNVLVSALHQHLKQFFKKYLFLLVLLGLHGCSGGYSLIVVQGHLIAVASLVSEHGL